MPDLTIAEPIHTGNHPDAPDGAGCGQECLRRELGLSWGDDLIDGQCPVLHKLVIAASDDPRTTTEERAPDGVLWAAIVRTLGTASPETTQARAYRCADWAVREVVPVALDSVGLGAQARTLRAVAPVVDERTAAAAAHAAHAAADTVAVAADTDADTRAAAAHASIAAHAAQAAATRVHAAADTATRAALAAGTAAATGVPRPLDLLVELMR